MLDVSVDSASKWTYEAEGPDQEAKGKNHSGEETGCKTAQEQVDRAIACCLGTLVHLPKGNDYACIEYTNE